jgi:hypothetical protein
VTPFVRVVKLVVAQERMERILNEKPKGIIRRFLNVLRQAC